MYFLLTLIKLKTIKEKTVNKYFIYRSKIKCCCCVLAGMEEWSLYKFFWQLFFWFPIYCFNNRSECKLFFGLVWLYIFKEFSSAKSIYFYIQETVNYLIYICVYIFLTRVYSIFFWPFRCNKHKSLSLSCHWQLQVACTIYSEHAIRFHFFFQRLQLLLLINYYCIVFHSFPRRDQLMGPYRVHSHCP